MSNVTVHYIKHWDNDTRGSMQFKANDIVDAAWQARKQLLTDAREDGVSSITPAIFTITKAEITNTVQQWTGIPAAGF